MKFCSVITYCLIIVFLMQCKAQADIGYELPEAMIASAKIEYAKQCEKGKILYEITCSQCHNMKEGRKKIIPDFTPEQLVGYELRIINPEHESGIPETAVSTEELGYIMTFLNYKKKSGKVFVSSKSKEL